MVAIAFLSFSSAIVVNDRASRRTGSVRIFRMRHKRLPLLASLPEDQQPLLSVYLGDLASIKSFPSTISTKSVPSVSHGTRQLIEGGFHIKR